MNGVEIAQGYRRMIYKLAWRIWIALPKQHRIWIGLDDLVEDGMYKAFEVVCGNWYDRRKSSLSTSIYHAVHNHLINEYVKKYSTEDRFASLESAGIIDYNEKHKRKKRGERGLTSAGVVSLDGVSTMAPDEQKLIVQAPQLSTSEDIIHDTVLTDCFVIPTLLKIHSDASRPLQHEIVVWFLQNKEKLNTDCRLFRRRTREFRELAKEHDLTYYDCLHLVHSSRCLDKLSRELIDAPLFPRAPHASRWTNKRV